MAEYIDRNVAIARVTALEVTEPFATMLDVRRDLADIPAADVAPVVRCKDCRYSGFDPEYGKRWCERCWGSMLVQDDDFCSYGEKREDRHE